MEYTRTIVAELHKKYAIVLDEGGNLQRIKRKNNMRVGDQIYYTPDDIYHESNHVLPFKSSHWMKPLILVAAIIFCFIGYQFIQNQIDQSSVTAAVSIGTESGLQLEIDANNVVTKVRDSHGIEITDSTLVGVHLDDLLPLLTAQVMSSDQDEIIIASTLNDSQFRDQLVEKLTKENGNFDVIYLNSDVPTYQAALKDKVALTDYEIQHKNINLWNDSEKTQLSASEKQARLGEAATYYQREINYHEFNRILQEKMKEWSDRLTQVIFLPKRVPTEVLESVDTPVGPIYNNENSQSGQTLKQNDDDLDDDDDVYEDDDDDVYEDDDDDVELYYPADEIYDDDDDVDEDDGDDD